MSTRQHCVDAPLEMVPTTRTRRAGKGDQQRHGGALSLPPGAWPRVLTVLIGADHQVRWTGVTEPHRRLRRWMAGWEQRPCPPTSTAFLKWGERESEADVTARQGALLHRRGFSWERRFGGLAGARAGKTKDHKWERNSEGPCGVVGG